MAKLTPTPFCRPLPLALLLVLAALCGCDNVGRAFDPDGSSSGGDDEVPLIQAMVPQGNHVDGRPKVRAVFPEGNGWPSTVPIVVVFNESINEASVAPGGETAPNLFVRQVAEEPSGGLGGPPVTPTAPTALAANYDFLQGGRVVLIRPVAPLLSPNNEEFEVVATAGLLDADGVRFITGGERVLATFTPDEAEEIEDGEILTVLPLDNAKDSLREAPVQVVFTKPPTQNSISTGAAGNLNLRLSGTTTPLAGDLSFPVNQIGPGNTADTRLVQWTPSSTLAAQADYELVVNGTIAFGTGFLDFRGRTPFARFRTQAVPAVDSVVVGNASSGAPDKVNSNNISTLRIDVDTPTDALAGDVVEVRIYGLDREKTGADDLAFLSAETVLAAAGAQTVAVDFSGLLGTVAAPQFREGGLTLAARLRRGSRASGYVLADSNNDPALDVTVPSLQTPAAVGGSVLLFTDQEYLTFVGTANEDISAASLVMDTTPVPAPTPATGVTYGFGSGGRFMFDPILLGHRTSPIGFSLTLTDAAGNIAPAVTGSVVQRGVITGSVVGGSLTVEAYDEATMLPIPGATILIEPGMPQSPAVGRQTALTASTGQAGFTGLGGGSYSITAVAAGYHITTVLDTSAGFVSLALRPQADATASLSGTAAFISLPGNQVLVGSNMIDDVRVEGVLTAAATPNAIPSIALRPARPYLVTAFSGNLEPTAVPTFTNFHISLAGADGVSKESAFAGAAAAASVTRNQTLLPAAGSARDLAAAYIKDLGTFTGFDAANLAADPRVRVVTTLFGLGGSTLTGIGYAEQQGATTSYSIQASYSLAAVNAFATLGPKFWISTSASDSSGNFVRHRRIVADPALGTTLASAAVPGVATITTPGGPSTGSPAVTVQDRLDAASIPQGFGFTVLTATDGLGRSWRLIWQDLDNATGTEVFQFPVMTGSMLSTGSWTVRAENTLMFSNTFGAQDYVFEEIRSDEVTFTRAASKTFTVN